MLSSSEPLAGAASAANGSAAADREAAYGEPGTTTGAGSCRHKINLFVLDQVCLVAAMNALLSNVLRTSRVQAGQQGAGGPAGRRQEQSSCTSYVLSMYKYVPSQSGQKISCISIYRHVLSTYEYILYLKISY